MEFNVIFVGAGWSLNCTFSKALSRLAGVLDVRRSLSEHKCRTGGQTFIPVDNSTTRQLDDREHTEQTEQTEQTVIEHYTQSTEENKTLHVSGNKTRKSTHAHFPLWAMTMASKAPTCFPLACTVQRSPCFLKPREGDTQQSVTGGVFN